MPSVNTKRIEESATTALKAALLRCPILESYIDSNDKTPSWDGTVFVYKSEKTKKEDLAGRVPIQIKGTEKVIVSDTATFSCSIADLNNYYKDGGCIFFLISVDLSSGNSRIFYKTLLVVDLDKIIKGAGKQKTSTIHLNLLPAEANEISSIFMEFTDNVHKQMGFIGKDIPTFESLEANGAEITSLTFTASGIGLTMDEIPKFLSTHDFYLYAKVKGLDVDVPIDKVTNAVISKPVDGEVRIRDRCFFPAYRVVYENGNSIIRIGKGISVALKAEENRITVHTDRPDTLSDFIIEADFFIELVEQGELTLNGVTIPLNGALLSDLQERKKILEYGYKVRWEPNQKYITYTTPENVRCRDNKLFDQTLLRSSMEAYFDMGGCEYLESRIDATEYGELLPTVDDAVCGLISILDAMNAGDNDRFHLETLHHSKQEIRRILERGGKIDRTVEYAVDDEDEEYEQYHGFSMRM